MPRTPWNVWHVWRPGRQRMQFLGCVLFILLSVSLCVYLWFFNTSKTYNLNSQISLKCTYKCFFFNNFFFIIRKLYLGLFVPVSFFIAILYYTSLVLASPLPTMAGWCMQQRLTTRGPLLCIIFTIRVTVYSTLDNGMLVPKRVAQLVQRGRG